jgi:hypothetical protein
MALMPLPESRVAILFAEHALHGSGAEQVQGGMMYGSALLARLNVSEGSHPEVLGKQRFVKGPVARLSATMVSPTSFVVAFRHIPAHSSLLGEKAEASCLLGTYHYGALGFDPKPLSLEPDQDEIWARSVAYLQDNLVAYTYHSGREQVTKQAVLYVDPATRQVSILREPEVISKGFTPFVGSLSTSTPLREHQSAGQLQLLEKQGARLFTYFAEGGGARGQFCRATPEDTLSDCQFFDWTSHELTSVSGTPVGDGRLLFFYADAGGSPHYQLVGLMDPL